jgi:hypothetical protein
MIHGQIIRLDVKDSSATIRTESGEEHLVRFTENTDIEVAEPCSLGTMGGTVADLTLGYHVKVALDDHNPDGTRNCSSLVSIS